MRTIRRYRWTKVSHGLVLALICIPVLIGLPPSAGEPDDPPRVARGPVLSAPFTPFVFDGDVRDLPRPRLWRPGDPIRMIPQRHYGAPRETPSPSDLPAVDPLLELQRLTSSESTFPLDGFTIPSRDFPGIDFTGAGPPDTVGDVGPNHYIQMVNSQEHGSLARIWDKAEPVPNLLATFVPSELAPDVCAFGFDPVVLYDREADRWLLTENGGDGVCFYLSRTADPVSGGWFVYTLPSGLPDYQKPAVWATDVNHGAGSFVVTVNEEPPSVHAYDRGAMLAGEPATSQSFFDTSALPGFLIHAATPADADGPNPPPPGSPAIVMRHRDTEIHDGPAAPGDLLEMWLLDVDWQEPANSTLTQAASIDVAEFDSTTCGLGFHGCFPQPGTDVTLFPLRELIMHRLQYYNHGDYESLLGNFVVDVDGRDHGGIRWFELRRTTADWALHQEGTYSIDDDHRWMGSIAMDQTGNIALGYNVVSTSLYPRLRYTGRMLDDFPGTISQPETEFDASTVASRWERWGDYAAMSLDPVDDCTFWFTGENTNADGYWRTQIASFRFEDCGCDPVPQPVLDAEAGGEGQINLLWEDSPSETAAEYIVRRSFTSGGPYETLAVIEDSSPGFAGGPGYVHEDIGVSGGVTYFYVVVTREENGCRSRPFNEVSAVTSGPCLVPPLFDGLSSAGFEPSELCHVDLEWEAATPLCGGPAAYNLYRSPVHGFVPGPESLVAEQVSGTSLSDMTGLEPNVTQHYVVRAVDLANQAEDQNGVERYATPTGPDTGDYVLLFEEFEAEGSFDAWSVVNGPEHECGEWARKYHCDPYNEGYCVVAESTGCGPDEEVTATSLVSPPFDLSDPEIASVALDFQSRRDYSPDDSRVIEAWDGSTWQLAVDLVNAYVFSPWDLTPYAAGNPEFRFRLRYGDTDRRGWWSVDDVELRVHVLDTCSTGSAPPVVTIAEPADGSSYAAGTEIPFAGSAMDPEDGDLSGDLAWTSSLDGAIGTGASFLFSGLSPGEHQIVAEVTDSDLMTGSAGVGIVVCDIEAPGRLKANASRFEPAIRLRWEDNSDNETSFEIERSLAPTSGFAPLDAVGADVKKYTDTGLESQTTYYYRIRACVEDCCSGWSDVADATTY